MSSVVISGDTSGSVSVTVPAVAGSNTITLPAVTGTAVISGQNSAITSGTSVSASGTSVAFTNIPSWVKRITVMYSSLSTNGSSFTQVQLGTSGGLVTSGYLSGFAYAGTTSGGGNYTTGLPVSSNSAPDVRHGMTVITNITGNTWVATMVNGQSNNAYAQFGGGSIALSGTLTQLAINMVNGTDVFDSGTINILYE